MGNALTKTGLRFEWRRMLQGGFECEVSQGSVCYALAVEPLQSSPWEQAVWMIHTPHEADARRVAVDLASTIDEGMAASEEACRRLFAGTIERVQ